MLFLMDFGEFEEFRRIFTSFKKYYKKTVLNI